MRCSLRVSASALQLRRAAAACGRHIDPAEWRLAQLLYCGTPGKLCAVLRRCVDGIIDGQLTNLGDCWVLNSIASAVA